MRNIPFLLWVLLLVDGESNNVKEAKEGESVTLEPGEIKEDDIIEWQFRRKKIAYMIKGQTIHNTFPGPEDLFKDRLKLDDQTGSLSITNILTEHAGLYQLKMSDRVETFTNFIVIVHVESVSVMVGDSVTLNINDTETEKAEELVWTIEGGMKNIAKFDRKTKRPPIYDTERFRGRLKLDHQTGSLTIMNITNITDSGEYRLLIKSSSSNKTKGFKVAVQDEVKSLSVMEGDTVTLNTGVTGILSARLNGTIDSNAENIDLNHTTGVITIRNIRRDQSGVYKVEINTSSVIIHREYNITLGEMMTISVKEGDPVNLLTGLFDVQGRDLILWKFKGTRIAEINKRADKSLIHDSANKIFNGRMQLNDKTGSLFISDSRSTDSGDYHLQMNSSSYIVQRNISVAVSVSDKQTPDSGQSSGAGGWIAFGVLLLVVFAAAGGVIYYRKKISKAKRSKDVAETKESINPLNPGTANGEGS